MIPNVRYDEQTLTEVQKSRARENIGASVGDNMTLLAEMISTEPVVQPLSYDSESGQFTCAADDIAGMNDGEEIQGCIVLNQGAATGGGKLYPYTTYNTLSLKRIDATHFILSSCTINADVNCAAWCIGKCKTYRYIDLSQYSDFTKFKVEVSNNSNILNFGNRANICINYRNWYDTGERGASTSFGGYVDHMLDESGYLIIEHSGTSYRYARQCVDATYISNQQDGRLSCSHSDANMLGEWKDGYKWLVIGSFTRGTKIRLYGWN